MRENIIKTKSFDFAIRSVRLHKFLSERKKEFVMSKQLLRCATCVGAMVREAHYAESTKDFQHKLAIALKESNESLYWLELLNATEYISAREFDSLHSDATEILKILTSILKTSKKQEP